VGGGVALAIFPGSGTGATLTGNLIRGNIARATNPAFSAKGAGIYILADDHVSLSSNLIQENQAEMLGGAGQGGGGGIYLDGGKVTMTNTVIAGNQIIGPGFGAGIFVFGANVDLLHTTIARNNGSDGSGVNVQQTGIVTLTNTILVTHTYGITVSTGSTATLTSILWFDNLLGNSAGLGTINNLSNEHTGDPAFTADGYHLGSGSAAIDKGINTGLTVDIDGETRIGPPDLGADEAPNPFFFFLPIIFRGP
jgi:hypothetical protein